MSSLDNILLLYAGMCLLNTALSAALWASSRTDLHRSMFIVWASTLPSLATQAALDQNHLAITLGFGFSFLINLALASLIAKVIEHKLRAKRFLSMLAVGCLSSSIAYAMELPFIAVSLPVAICVAAPCLYTSLLALIRYRNKLSLTGKALAVSAFFFAVHNLDFPFLREVPNATPIAITVAVLIIFALSIFAPAVVLEILTEQQARARAEIDLVARIQTEILPREPHIEGLELECYMRPAESAGGDYYDIITIRDAGWLLIGDVTGHGLGSGMVMLMAQSIITSLLQTHEGISPGQLNHRANQILFNNLQRIGGDRTMTIVSLCFHRDSGELLISGCHDDVYIYRANTGDVETLEMTDFPFGLGFLEDLEEGSVDQQKTTLDQGDILFLGTDGITEAAYGGDYNAGMFGADRLLERIKRFSDAPLSELKTQLLHDLDDYTNGVFHDDFTFVIARRSD